MLENFCLTAYSVNRSVLIVKKLKRYYKACCSSILEASSEILWYTKHLLGITSPGWVIYFTFDCTYTMGISLVIVICYWLTLISTFC